MGMYDYLHSISRNIEQNQVDIKKSQEHQKKVEYIQTELEGALLASLQDKIKYSNIFNDETKSIAIDEVLHSEDLMLYNKDYTRQYLNKKYYTIARQVEQIEKKQNSNKDDYKKQIAIEKWDLQKQIMQQKLNEKNQKEAEKRQLEALRKQQARRQLINDVLKVVGQILIFTMKATAYMIIAPLFLLACFCGGFLGGMIKLK